MHRGLGAEKAKVLRSAFSRLLYSADPNLGVAAGTLGTLGTLRWWDY